MTATINKSASVLIVDDHPLMRRAVRGLIQTDPMWQVVGEAASGHAGIAEAEELQPEIVVLDLGLPDMNGTEAIEAILRAAPATLLVLTMDVAGASIEAAIRAGASGYVLKSDVEEELLAGITALVEGSTYFNAPGAQRAWQRLRAEEKAESERSLADALSTREREILSLLLLEGNNNRLVAERLRISRRTVENHRARIMQKLAVHSFGDLLRLAIRIELIEA
jgi:RNA polymerase sigma factor (sigma-70 family)